MQIHYLEIVTPDVEDACAQYAAIFGVSFGTPDASLGNAYTADLANGGRIGIRAPLSDTEEPIVRPYFLTANIEHAIESLRTAGAEITHPALELPNHGTFAIYQLGGVNQGLWQL